MTEKEVKKPEPKVIDFGSLSTYELLLVVASMIEQEKGTHSPKHYRMLADDVRALAERL